MQQFPVISVQADGKKFWPNLTFLSVSLIVLKSIQGVDTLLKKLDIGYYAKVFRFKNKSTSADTTLAAIFS